MGLNLPASFRGRTAFRRGLWALGPLAVWAFLHRTFLRYALTHGAAWSWESGAGVGVALARWGGVILLLLGCAEVGKFFQKTLSPASPAEEKEDPLVQGVLWVGLGIVALSTTLFFLGVVRAWVPSVLGGLSVGMGALGLRRLWIGGPAVRSVQSGPPFSTFEKAALVVLGLAALQGFIKASVPPTDWDSLAVHLTLPRLFLKAGGLVPLPDMLHGHDPLSMNVLYTLGLMWGDASFAGTLNVGLEFLLVLALYGVARQWMSRPAALGACVLFVLSPIALFVRGTAGTDLGLAFFFGLSLLCLGRWVQTRKTGWWVQAGIFQGFALGIKLTGPFFFGAMAAGFLLWGIQNKTGGRAWAGYVGLALLVASPTYLWNFWVTGNPVWPHFATFFSQDLSVQSLAVRMKVSAQEGVSPSWTHLLQLPYLLLVHGEKFRHTPAVTLVPLLTVLGMDRDGWVRQRGLGLLIVPGILFTLGWFGSLQSWRYFFPWMPLLALITAGAAENLWTRGGKRRGLIVLTLVGAVGFPQLAASNELFGFFRLRPSNPDQTWKQAYLAKNVNSYPLQSYINDTLPPQARVLLFREVRGFYLNRSFFYGDPQNDTVISYDTLATPSDLHRRLLSLGVTHVLVNPSLTVFREDWPAYLRAENLMKETLCSFATVRREENGAILFEVRP